MKTDKQIMSETYTFNAVQGTKSLEHFGIHPMTASLYGDKPEDIIEVKMNVSSDQTPPEKNTICKEADYWGWYEYDEDRFSLIYPQKFLLDMCFPNIKVSEERQQGKAFRLIQIK